MTSYDEGARKKCSFYALVFYVCIVKKLRVPECFCHNEVLIITYTHIVVSLSVFAGKDRCVDQVYCESWKVD
jgi:hypothetical protein